MMFDYENVCSGCGQAFKGYEKQNMCWDCIKEVLWKNGNTVLKQE